MTVRYRSNFASAFLRRVFFAIGLLVFPYAAAEANEGANCKELRGLVILVAFPGTPQVVTPEIVNDRFFGKLNRYVQQISYNKVCVVGELSKRWYELPRPISQYSISPRNLEVDKSRIKNLVDDVLEMANPDFDLSAYDFVAFMLGAKQSEYGMIGLSAYPGMLGWQSGKQFKSASGKPIRGIAIYSYQAHLGTLFHDIAHVIGGVMPNGNRTVPCLYDHDLQARPGPLRETFIDSTINMGLWDPMSSHFNKRDEPPPGISSWTKLRLGWLPESKVASVAQGELKEILLGPLEDGDSETLAVRVPVSPGIYYLIENRQPIGVDKVLPGSGVLIMRADDSVAECRRGNAPVKLINADPSVPHLEGAAFDVGRRSRYADQSSGFVVELLEKIGDSYRIRVGLKPL